MLKKSTLGRHGDVSPPFCRWRDFWRFFFIHAAFCSYKVAYRGKSAACGSRANRTIAFKIRLQNKENAGGADESEKICFPRFAEAVCATVCVHVHLGACVFNICNVLYALITCDN